MTLLFDLALRSSVILVAGLAMSALLRRRSAAVRHGILATAIVAAAAVAPLAWILPAWHVSLPAVFAEPAAALAPTTVDVALPGPLAAPNASSSSAAYRVLPLAGIIWAMGLVAGVALLLAGLIRVLVVSARAERLHHGRWTRIAEQVSRAYGLKRPVSILQTNAPDLLATFGLFRPRVLLPAHARHWTDERARIVLCHELAHVRRHDWLVQIGAEALRTIYWFNPLFWMACTHLRRESEQACDDAVLDAGVAAREYAAHLLELARSCRRSTAILASAMPMARRSTLERRVAAMLNPGLDRGTLSRRAHIVAVLLLLVVTLPIAALRAGQSAPLPLAGSVYDASGAVLPGVEMTLENDRQIKWQATTDAAGRFEFPPVDVGNYVLEAAVAGFRPLRHELELKSARDWNRAITLQVGDLKETVHVMERRLATPQPAVQAQGTVPVRVGGNIRAPHKLRNVPPVYPPTMRDAGLEGVVPMEALIGRDGSVQSVRVLSAQIHPDFAVAAVDAVRQWRYDATLLNGVPVEVRMNVSVRFSLSDK